jgi:hypothetical protein
MRKHRYFLVRDGLLDGDGDYNADTISKRFLADLADTLGNLGVCRARAWECVCCDNTCVVTVCVSCVRALCAPNAWVCVRSVRPFCGPCPPRCFNRKLSRVGRARGSGRLNSCAALSPYCSCLLVGRGVAVWLARRCAASRGVAVSLLPAQVVPTVPVGAVSDVDAEFRGRVVAAVARCLQQYHDLDVR